MNSAKHFDFVIIGSGVAGLHLAYQFSKNSFFDHKVIAIIDQSITPEFNRVLSYWERGEGIWDTVVKNSWKTVNFKSQNVDLLFDLDEHYYKSLDFKDFSVFCLHQIKSKTNFHFIQDKVTGLKYTDTYVEVNLGNAVIVSDFVFDSRISKDYFKNKSNYPFVIQSFKGWEVVFENAVFDTKSFTMMDYRHQWKSSNSFMYILPSSSKTALLEYTFFAPFTISDQSLDAQISDYINSFFKGEKYILKSTEKGEIPMTTYPFQNTNSTKVLKIGTAGGWVKPSTGYSFKFAEKNAIIISEQIAKNQVVTGYKSPFRFRFYDKLFIKVLQNQNVKGPVVFEKMYKKVKLSRLFDFLDEKTSLKQEIGIILKLPYLPFLKELFRFF